MSAISPVERRRQRRPVQRRLRDVRDRIRRDRSSSGSRVLELILCGAIAFVGAVAHLFLVVGVAGVTGATWLFLVLWLAAIGAAAVAFTWWASGAPRDPRACPRALRRPPDLKRVGAVAVALQPDQRCPFCHDDLAGVEAGRLLTCAACRAVAHGRCVLEAGACATLGCRNGRRRGRGRAAAQLTKT